MMKSQRTLPLYIGLGMVLFVVLTAVHTTTAAPPYDPNSLSYGLYWFGTDGANQKFVHGEANPYFDPDKPTLIFVHGWQPFLSYNLPNFDVDGEDTAASWISSGWNVGIFVWNQFADETTDVVGGGFGDGAPPQGVLDAEEKIWTANGLHGMRWRDWDSLVPPLGDGYSDPPPNTPSAGDLFYQIYASAMTEQSYTGGNIRIAGHSLGNQMAVRLTKLIADDIQAGNLPETVRPDRVALLDPYWSPDARSYLANRTTGAVVREYIKELSANGTLFEWYWSSDWTTPPQGDANDALKPLVFYAEMDPAYADQDVDKHLAAQDLYFGSYAFEGPTDCTGDECLGMTRVLSKMSDEQLTAVIHASYYWIQDGGQDSATSEDDTYHSIYDGSLYLPLLLK